jgi:hypothetical protein
MVKRKSATAEHASGKPATNRRRSDTHATQDSLPGTRMSEASMNAPAQASAQATRRRATPQATVEVALRVAPSNGPRQPARARQEPAATSSAADTPPSATRAQSKRPRTSSSRRIGDLREALADGWEIVQPIFARPLWSSADDSQTAFNFVLRRDQATRLLTIPDSRTVERFITTHSLQVDYRR